MFIPFSHRAHCEKSIRFHDNHVSMFLNLHEALGYPTKEMRE